jgi:hypothetical protein
LLGETTN